ncbi:MAG: ATP-binding protein [Bradyrhizobium sp.]|uniref:ATP-binding protein n=1 Tax=Bradyrhizobium sp. TaxID=376 RepID=UPI0029A1F43F|nr:ATP-binding protein [Bradyrhizobium sp.]MDX3966047.1 ATP-binding protein [Bradyrhizobium sp.]
MSIAGFNRDRFVETLQATLSPTTPIRSPEHLRGREKKLEDIRRALVQAGRSVFVYGDRGVGKTSLAQTAAYEHQSASKAPVLIGCDASSTFARVVQQITTRLLGLDATLIKQANQQKAGLASNGISAEAQRSIERGPVPLPNSVDEATTMMSQAAKKHSAVPVIVIDEFERITANGERTLFADLIKQTGDQSMPFKLIFCGVASSLDELLDAHHSCYRYLVTVELERLPPEPRFEIINEAAKAFGIAIEPSSLGRIAAISDGFPHYIHLITEKLLWEIFSDVNLISLSTPAHFLEAIRTAVLDIEAKLRTTYEKATKKYVEADQYEAVLWALADHHELSRRSADIFNGYVHLTRTYNINTLPRDKFTQRINALKRPTHGSILKGSRQGWYEFSEPVMRGYVRLQAEAQNVTLGADHPAEYRGYNRLQTPN